jgi:hypothetical protein
MKNETKRIADVYVTARWATKGIILVHGATVYEHDRRLSASWGPWGAWAHGRNVHFTYEEACARVAERAKCKRAALAKQLKKVVALERAARGGTAPVYEVVGERKD